MTRTITLILALLLLTAFSVNADRWSPPRKEKYYSLDKKYYVEVVPKKLESQLKYFQDKVNNKENPGAFKEARNNYVKGTLFKQNEDGSYRKLHSFRLVNEVSPLHVIVSNNGSFIATFDNWHSAGYGPDAVVIYRSDGSVVRQLALEDFLTENDIATLPMTTSSRWWGRDHYFEEKTNLLVLRIVSSTESKWSGSALEGAKFYEVKLNPTTGSLVEAKRDLLPRWEPQVSSDYDLAVVADAAWARPPDPACIKQSGASAAKTPIRVSSAELYQSAQSKPLPRYPRIAQQAHAEGTVVVEVVTDETGKVICSRGLSGHPLLMRMAVEGAKEWTFTPKQDSDGSHQLIGNIVLHFRFVKVVP